MRYKILIGIFIALPFQLLADEPRRPLPPLVMEGKYTVAWNGITIGRVNLTTRETESSYHMLVDTKTSGVAALFKRERRLAEATGRIDDAGRHIPTRFHSRPHEADDEAEDYTILTYDPQGQLMSRTRVPDDDPSWRAPVPFPQASGATDPVTAGLVLRRELYVAIEMGQSTISTRTYDGARLAELRMAIKPKSVTLDIGRDKTPALETHLSRQPVAGYTPKELKKFDAGDPPIRFYFSADGNYMPLRVAIAVFAGELTATLDRLPDAKR